MSKKGWVGGALAKGGVAGVASYVTTTYIIPLGAPIVTAAIGYADGWPWLIIWLGALAAFSFVSTGLLRFSEWRYRQQVKDKLNLNVVRVGRKLNNQGCAESVTLGFQLYNNALFPVEFELQSLHSMIDDKYPPNKDYALRQFVMPSGGLGWFDDFAIELPDAPRERTIEGMIEFVVHYGRLGYMKHELRKKFQVFLGFDANGDVKGANWNEVRMC